jgi:2-C-methyl-D-erythritol 4-phosphate cytidylyltransferase
MPMPEPRRAGLWTIVVAGGSGSRFGGPKQLALLDADRGMRVVDLAVECAHKVSDGVVVVRPHGSDPLKTTADLDVEGGSSRVASVAAGIDAVPLDAKFIAVHDAARPWATPRLFDRVLEAIIKGGGGVDGAVPGVSVVDTIKRIDDGRVVETLMRDELVAVQTPQIFRAAALRHAHRHLAGTPAERAVTDDASMVELCGGTVLAVDGEPANIKITVPADLMRQD